MNEHSSWPEASRFVSDSDLKQKCAELVLETLAFAGNEAVFPDNTKTMMTDFLDAVELRDDRYQDALRLQQCAYAEVPLVESGEIIKFEAQRLDEIQMFALQHGVFDADTLSHDVDALDVDDTNYLWKSIVCIVIDMRVGGPLNESMVSLIDANDGTEIGPEATLHLFSMLEALAGGLRSQSFSAGTIDNAKAPQLKAESGIAEDHFDLEILQSDLQKRRN
ncbi:hypothetical protein H7Y40_01630 [Pedobacter sp.]|nr:hypothetical protein [Candidatus Saccharibacteria bacterium]